MKAVKVRRKRCPKCRKLVQFLTHPTPHLAAHFDLSKKQWCNLEPGVNFK